jgi:hypothetical protein
MKTLILVHVENTFRRFFPDGFIRNLRLLLPRYHVIHATSCINDYDPIEEIADLVDEKIDWGWGYEPEVFNEDERRFLIESSGHEWTWIPPELRSSRFRDVRLGGGCNGECLTDMECVLRHQKIRYRLLPSIVY